MNRFNMVGAAVLLLSAQAFADDAPKKAKVAELMREQGLLQTFQQQLEMGSQYAEKQAAEMRGQLLGQLNASDEFKKRFDAALDKLKKKIVTPWDADYIVDLWSKLYGAKFSESELDEMLAYYKSPVAKKEVTASREALKELGAHFQEEGKKLIQPAMQDYIQELESIARECNCAKPAGGSKKKR